MQDEDVVGDNPLPMPQLPRPGDLVVAKNRMKSRVLDEASGDWSHWPQRLTVEKGDVCLVIQTYMFQTQFRMVVLCRDQIMRFAQKPHRAILNWERHVSTDPA